MRLSKKCEYACLALIDLSEQFGKGNNRISEIAERKAIPKKFLEQILLLLKTTGYLHSVKGPDGGYSLKKHPNEITLAEIVRLFDGALAPVESVSKFYYKSSPTEQSKSLTELFREIRDYIALKLEAITFADLADVPEKENEIMEYNI